MSSSALFRIRRPYSTEDEAYVYRVARHQCRGPDAADELLFPVGFFGQGMPIGAAFEVESSEECAACGAVVKAWAEWTGPTIVNFGA